MVSLLMFIWLKIKKQDNRGGFAFWPMKIKGPPRSLLIILMVQMYVVEFFE
jgi:hypothetical protein